MAKQQTVDAFFGSKRPAPAAPQAKKGKKLKAHSTEDGGQKFYIPPSQAFPKELFETGEAGDALRAALAKKSTGDYDVAFMDATHGPDTDTSTTSVPQ